MGAVTNRLPLSYDETKKQLLVCGLKKNPQKLNERKQEVILSFAAAKEIILDAAAAAVLSEMDWNFSQ